MLILFHTNFWHFNRFWSVLWIFKKCGNLDIWLGSGAFADTPMDGISFLSFPFSELNRRGVSFAFVSLFWVIFFFHFFEVSLGCHRSWGLGVWVIRLTCGIESCWPSPAATQSKKRANQLWYAWRPPVGRHGNNDPILVTFTSQFRPISANFGQFAYLKMIFW